MTVNFYNTDIYHMCLGKEHQLSYDLKNEWLTWMIQDSYTTLLSSSFLLLFIALLLLREVCMLNQLLLFSFLFGVDRFRFYLLLLMAHNLSCVFFNFYFFFGFISFWLMLEPGFDLNIRVYVFLGPFKLGSIFIFFFDTTFSFALWFIEIQEIFSGIWLCWRQFN